MNVDGPWFTEPKTNRTILFRGINLGGGTKVPAAVPSHEPNGFWIDYDRKVTFVGRPFPIEEADVHLQRLVDLGINLLRFMMTWEAIEHEGPGIYDEAYLDYVITLLHKCKDYGLKVFMNPHQDTWSRHCGGSGHPGWTHTLAGLNPADFAPTGAAIVQNVYPEPEKFPKMIWHTNHKKLAAATMFTLFYGGKIFAPKCIVNGVHIQDYLQSHYYNAFRQMVTRIQACGLHGDVVIGYDTMNEPGTGFIGQENITSLSDEDVDLKKGPTPTSFQAMKLGSGIPTEVENWVFTWRGPKKQGIISVDPGDARAWLSPSDRDAADALFGWERSGDWKPGCIWANHGVWDPQTQTVMRPDYFKYNPKTCDLISYQTLWLEFMKSYADMILDIYEHAIIFVQPPIMEIPPPMPSKYSNVAYAPHWYDGLTLVKKQWCNYNVDYINLKRGKYGNGPLRFVRALRIGEKAIRQCFVDQIETLKTEGANTVGHFPFVLGETGIPYDLEPTKTSALGDFLYNLVARVPNSPQNKAMDATINAAEKNLVSYVLWTYVPDNDPRWGDLWNGEDLSIWQEDQTPKIGEESSVSETSSRTLVPENLQSQKQPTQLQMIDSKALSTSNARDIISLHRPHPRKIAGVPLVSEFVSPTEKVRASYSLRFRYAKGVEGPSEIYVPSVHFPPPEESGSTEMTVSSGRVQVRVPGTKYWIILWWCDDGDDGGQEQVLQLTGLRQTEI
ncbi:glycoside hydrolase superfamily [Dichotomocladium elegans]|nr:glycoside hydrolase superfamily [Dichotomocladium elegans]